MFQALEVFNGCCKRDIKSLWCDINIYINVSTVTLAVKKELQMATPLFDWSKTHA